MVLQQDRRKLLPHTTMNNVKDAFQVCNVSLISTEHQRRRHLLTETMVSPEEELDQVHTVATL